MSTLNYIAKTFSTLKNRTKKNNPPPPKNELIHPRFGITETDKKEEKKRAKLFIVFDVLKRK